MSADDFAKSDEELGKWLLATWLGYHAEKSGIPLNAIPESWAAGIVKATAAIDSDNMKNAPLESAFRKAAKGDFAGAGKMLRASMWKDARDTVAAKYTPIGIKQTKLRREGGDESGRVRSEKATKWQADCVAHAKNLLATGTAPHELAGKCADRFHRTSDTIRRVLRKAGVK